MLEHLYLHPAIFTFRNDSHNINSLTEKLSCTPVRIIEVLDELLRLPENELELGLELIESHIAKGKLLMTWDEANDPEIQPLLISLTESGNARLAQLGCYMIVNVLFYLKDKKLLVYLKKFNIVPTPLQGFYFQKLVQLFYQSLGGNCLQAIDLLKTLHLFEFTGDIDLEISLVILHLLSFIRESPLAEKEKLQKIVCSELLGLYARWSSSLDAFLQIITLLLEDAYPWSKDSQSELFGHAFEIFEGKDLWVKNFLLPKYVRLILRLPIPLRCDSVKSWCTSFSKSQHSSLITQITTSTGKGLDRLHCFHLVLRTLFDVEKNKVDFLKDNLPLLLKFHALFEPDDSDRIYLHWTKTLLDMDYSAFVRLGKPLLLDWLTLLNVILEHSYPIAEAFLEKLKPIGNQQEKYFKAQIILVSFLIKQRRLVEAVSKATSMDILWRVTDAIIEIIPIEDYQHLSLELTQFLQQNISKLTLLQKVHLYLKVYSSDATSASAIFIHFLQSLKELENKQTPLDTDLADRIVVCFINLLKDPTLKNKTSNSELLPYILAQTKKVSKENEELLTEIWKIHYEEQSRDVVIRLSEILLSITAYYPNAQAAAFLQVKLSPNRADLMYKLVYSLELLTTGVPTPYDEELNQRLLEGLSYVKDVKIKDRNEFKHLLILLSQAELKKRISVNTVINAFIELCLLDISKELEIEVVDGVINYLDSLDIHSRFLNLKLIVDGCIKKAPMKTEFELYLILSLSKTEWVVEKFDNKQLKDVFQPAISKILDTINVSYFEESLRENNLPPDKLDQYSNLIFLLKYNLEITFIDHPTPKQTMNLAKLCLFFKKHGLGAYFEKYAGEIITHCETSTNFAFILPFMNYMIRGLQANLNGVYFNLNENSITFAIRFFGLYCQKQLLSSSKTAMTEIIALVKGQQAYLGKVSLASVSAKAITEKYLFLGDTLANENPQNEVALSNWKSYVPTIPPDHDLRIRYLKLWELTTSKFSPTNIEKFGTFLREFIPEVLRKNEIDFTQRLYITKKILHLIERVFTQKKEETKLSIYYSLKTIFFLKEILVFLNAYFDDHINNYLTVKKIIYLYQVIFDIVKSVQNTHTFVDTESLALIRASLFELTKTIRHSKNGITNKTLREKIQKSVSAHNVIDLIILEMDYNKSTHLDKFIAELEMYIKKINSDHLLKISANMKHIKDALLNKIKTVSDTDQNRKLNLILMKLIALEEPDF